MREFQVIIIGSGQAGGPLAHNLADAGWKVALIEREHSRGTQYQSWDYPVGLGGPRPRAQRHPRPDESGRRCRYRPHPGGGHSRPQRWGTGSNADDLDDALDIAYKNVELIQFEGKQYRKDIGRTV